MAEVSPVKKHVDYANSQVDEQAILDKFNAATAAQYNAQREQNRQAENQFYNQMYNTQQTAMDTIRKSNAAAVSSGASRGVQAANELSAILGLEQESVASATELANANRQTAQEETAAVLENVLNAYKQAAQERQTIAQQGIEAQSVDVQQQATQAQSQESAAAVAGTIVSASENGTSAYLSSLSEVGKDYKTPSAEGLTSIGSAIEGVPVDIVGAGGDIFTGDDWKGSGTGYAKAIKVETKVKQICDAYGIPYSEVSSKVERLKEEAGKGSNWTGIFTESGQNKDNTARFVNEVYAELMADLEGAYRKRLNATDNVGA